MPSFSSSLSSLKVIISIVSPSSVPSHSLSFLEKFKELEEKSDSDLRCKQDLLSLAVNCLEKNREDEMRLGKFAKLAVSLAEKYIGINHPTTLKLWLMR